MGCRRRSVCLERLGNRWGGGDGSPFFGGGGWVWERVVFAYLLSKPKAIYIYRQQIKDLDARNRNSDL